MRISCVPGIVGIVGSDASGADVRPRGRVRRRARKGRSERVCVRPRVGLVRNAHRGTATVTPRPLCWPVRQSSGGTFGVRVGVRVRVAVGVELRVGVRVRVAVAESVGVSVGNGQRLPNSMFTNCPQVSETVWMPGGGGNVCPQPPCGTS